MVCVGRRGVAGAFGVVEAFKGDDGDMNVSVWASMGSLWWC